MNPSEALSVLRRYWPCPHNAYDPSLGDGTTWAQCYDCGDTFEVSRLEAIRRREAEFLEAFDTLQQMVTAHGG